MSRLLSSLAFVVALFASVESALANEHQAHCRYCNAFSAWADPPQASNGRNYAPDRQVDVKHIKLDVTPDFEHRTVSGTATIRFAPILKPAKSLRLDGVRLEGERRSLEACDQRFLGRRRERDDVCSTRRFPWAKKRKSRSTTRPSRSRGSTSAPRRWACRKATTIAGRKANRTRPGTGFPASTIRTNGPAARSSAMCRRR